MNNAPLFTSPGLWMDNPFDNPAFRKKFCHPNSKKINASRYWKLIQDEYETMAPPPSYPNEGIFFERFAVVSVSSINHQHQWARSSSFNTERVNELAQSFAQQGWRSSEPVICVTHTRALEDIVTTIDFSLISEEHVAITAKHRVQTLKFDLPLLLKEQGDPYGLAKVFDYVLVAIYRYENPQAVYLHDGLSNRHLPSSPSTMTDIIDVINRQVDLGYLESASAGDSAKKKIHALIDQLGKHLSLSVRGKIKSQFLPDIVSVPGQLVKPVQQAPERFFKEAWPRIFAPAGVPSPDHVFYTDNGSIARAIIHRLPLWASKWRASGQHAPIMVVPFQPKTQTNANKSLAVTRSKNEDNCMKQRRDFARTLTEVVNYLHTKMTQPWEMLSETEKLALMDAHLPIYFVGHMPQNILPNPKKKGATMESPNALVDVDGRVSSLLSQYYPGDAPSAEDVAVATESSHRRARRELPFADTLLPDILGMNDDEDEDEDMTSTDVTP